MYAVMGSPIAHSRSPELHRLFASDAGLHVQYDKIEVPSGGLAAALKNFAASGGRGVNITAPLKSEAFALCASNISERAQRVGAVNTLTYDALANQWHGDSTDGIGLIRSLTAHFGQDLRERRTLLLGAGGAARSAAIALLDAGISELWIVNREEANADALADFIGEPSRVHSRRPEQLGEMGSFDLIVNALSVSPVPAWPLTGDLLNRHTLVVDLNYGERAIEFAAWSKAHNVPLHVDGFSMLVEQAAESFRIWHGVEPDTAKVYDALR